MRTFSIFDIIAGITAFSLCACTHFGAPSSASSSTNNTAITAFTNVCVEARSEERRVELQTMSKLALAYLDSSGQQRVVNKDHLHFIAAATCNEDTLEHTLIIALPNLRRINESFEQKTKFRRPHLMKSNQQCIATYGPLYFTTTDEERGNIKLFLSPFVNWRTDSLKDIAKKIEAHAPLSAFVATAQNFQREKTRAMGDDSVEAYCSALDSEKTASGTKDTPNEDLGAFTPSIDLYPIALEGLRNSLSGQKASASPEVSSYNLPVNYFLTGEPGKSREQAACSKLTLTLDHANPCH